ncbi:MAG TPA: hypothetical protein VN455_13955, partial [Methanotrichaceae archaeon]|nr:hypothetical protein [Methanotrichaceae archaeon]
QEDIKKIAAEVSKKLASSISSGTSGAEALSASAGATCFRCGRLGTYRCEDNFECTTEFRCGRGFIRVAEQV